MNRVSLWFTASFAFLSSGLPAHAELPPPRIPEHNNPRLRRAPPLPPIAEADLGRARTLLRGIQADNPDIAREAFLPEDVFARIKGVADPSRIYHRLMREFAADVHALHAEVPAGAVVDELVLSRRRGWVEQRQEANRLPYWSARHNTLRWVVPVQGATDATETPADPAGPAQRGEFEIRTLITWDDQWYITHLREFAH